MLSWSPKKHNVDAYYRNGLKVKTHAQSWSFRAQFTTVSSKVENGKLLPLAVVCTIAYVLLL